MRQTDKKNTAIRFYSRFFGARKNDMKEMSFEHFLHLSLVFWAHLFHTVRGYHKNIVRRVTNKNRKESFPQDKQDKDTLNICISNSGNILLSFIKENKKNRSTFHLKRQYHRQEFFIRTRY